MRVLGILLIVFFSANLLAKENKSMVSQHKPDHSIWNGLLQKHVDSKGNVNYKAFKKDSLSLEAYLKQFEEISPAEDWTKNEKMAFYINLYNAATVKLILDNYPLKSIKEIKKPWDTKWIKIGDELFSLGEIEHKILRKMKDPRIHFAINCASYSCPKLSNKTYTPETLEKQLDNATRDFINDPSKNAIFKTHLELSNIFKWYKADFTENGTLEEFVNQYTNTKIKTNSKIKFLEYDWSLNERK